MFKYSTLFITLVLRFFFFLSSGNWCVYMSACVFMCVYASTYLRTEFQFCQFRSFGIQLPRLNVLESHIWGRMWLSRERPQMPTQVWPIVMGNKGGRREQTGNSRKEKAGTALESMRILQPVLGHRLGGHVVTCVCKQKWSSARFILCNGHRKHVKGESIGKPPHSGQNEHGGL